MIQIEFKYTCNYENQPRTNIIMTTDAVSLDDILVAFEDFLRGSGFGFNGHIELVEEND